jgi:hypothetical protein
VIRVVPEWFTKHSVDADLAERRDLHKANPGAFEPLSKDMAEDLDLDERQWSEHSMGAEGASPRGGRRASTPAAASLVWSHVEVRWRWATKHHTVHAYIHILHDQVPWMAEEDETLSKIMKQQEAATALQLRQRGGAQGKPRTRQRVDWEAHAGE